MIAMRVLGLTMDKASMTPILLLKVEDGNNQVLPIWIGGMEAMSISLSLENISLERPLTHDLLLGALEAVGAKLVSARITGMHEGTFYAKLELLHNEQMIVIDCRPSDAVALALRAKVTIYAAEEVLKKAPMEAFRFIEGENQAIIEKVAMPRPSGSGLTEDEQLSRLLQSMEPASRRRM
jgi:bifunctional DNase/RNase